LYMAPEIFRPPFTEKIDLWSLGVLAFYLVTGQVPFPGSTVTEVKSNVLYRRLQWPVGVPVAPDCRDFIEKLLEKDPNIRPSAIEALRHPFLATAVPERIMSYSISINLKKYRKFKIIKKLFLNLIFHYFNFNNPNLIILFSEFDKSLNGLLTLPEIVSALITTGVSTKEAWECARGMDIDQTGIVTYTSFITAVGYPLITEKVVKKSFKLFSNSKKILNLNLILEILKNKNNNFDFLKLIENEFDNNYEINFELFRKLLLN
jgi:calcium-dependent protein kinase